MDTDVLIKDDASKGTLATARCNGVSQPCTFYATKRVPSSSLQDNIPSIAAKSGKNVFVEFEVSDPDAGIPVKAFYNPDSLSYIEANWLVNLPAAESLSTHAIQREVSVPEGTAVYAPSKDGFFAAIVEKVLKQGQMYRVRFVDEKRGQKDGRSEVWYEQLMLLTKGAPFMKRLDSSLVYAVERPNKRKDGAGATANNDEQSQSQAPRRNQPTAVETSGESTIPSGQASLDGSSTISDTTKESGNNPFGSQDNEARGRELEDPKTYCGFEAPQAGGNARGEQPPAQSASQTKTTRPPDTPTAVWNEQQRPVAPAAFPTRPAQSKADSASQTTAANTIASASTLRPFNQSRTHKHTKQLRKYKADTAVLLNYQQSKRRKFLYKMANEHRKERDAKETEMTQAQIDEFQCLLMEAVDEHNFDCTTDASFLSLPSISYNRGLTRCEGCTKLLPAWYREDRCQACEMRLSDPDSVEDNDTDASPSSRSLSPSLSDSSDSEDSKDDDDDAPPAQKTAPQSATSTIHQPEEPRTIAQEVNWRLEAQRLQSLSSANTASVNVLQESATASRDQAPPPQTTIYSRQQEDLANALTTVRDLKAAKEGINRTRPQMTSVSNAAGSAGSEHREPGAPQNQPKRKQRGRESAAAAGTLQQVQKQPSQLQHAAGPQAYASPSHEQQLHQSRSHGQDELIDDRPAKRLRAALADERSRNLPSAPDYRSYGTMQQGPRQAYAAPPASNGNVGNIGSGPSNVVQPQQGDNDGNHQLLARPADARLLPISASLSQGPVATQHGPTRPSRSAQDLLDRYSRGEVDTDFNSVRFAQPGMNPAPAAVARPQQQQMFLNHIPQQVRHYRPANTAARTSEQVSTAQGNRQVRPQPSNPRVGLHPRHPSATLPAASPQIPNTSIMPPANGTGVAPPFVAPDGYEWKTRYVYEAGRTVYPGGWYLTKLDGEQTGQPSSRQDPHQPAQARRFAQSMAMNGYGQQGGANTYGSQGYHGGPPQSAVTNGYGPSPAAFLPANSAYPLQSSYGVPQYLQGGYRSVPQAPSNDMRLQQALGWFASGAQGDFTGMAGVRGYLAPPPGNVYTGPPPAASINHYDINYQQAVAAAAQTGNQGLGMAANIPGQANNTNAGNAASNVLVGHNTAFQSQAAPFPQVLTQGNVAAPTQAANANSNQQAAPPPQGPRGSSKDNPIELD